MRKVLTAAVLSLATATAWAGPGDDGTHHREGEYGGVSPAGTPSPDARMKRPAPRTLGWIGYAATDGTGEVFFQAAQPFTITQRVESGAVVVQLSGLTKLARNTRRPLDTTFFDAPVARISAKTVRASRARRGQPARAAGVEVRIAFKAGAVVTEGVTRTATEKDGLYYVYLTFAGPTQGPDAPD